jgi:hypothetical protein
MNNFSRASGAAAAWLLLFILLIGGSLYERNKGPAITHIATVR